MLRSTTIRIFVAALVALQTPWLGASAIAASTCPAPCDKTPKTTIVVSEPKVLDGLGTADLSITMSPGSKKTVRSLSVRATQLQLTFNAGTGYISCFTPFPSYYPIDGYIAEAPIATGVFARLYFNDNYDMDSASNTDAVSQKIPFQLTCRAVYGVANAGKQIQLTVEATTTKK